MPHDHGNFLVPALWSLALLRTQKCPGLGKLQSTAPSWDTQGSASQNRTPQAPGEMLNTNKNEFWLYRTVLYWWRILYWFRYNFSQQKPCRCIWRTMTIPNWAVFKYCLNVFPLIAKCNGIKKYKLFHCEMVFKSQTFSGCWNTSAQAAVQSSSPPAPFGC